jgi:uncharacterized protein YdaU (DUF1376 family)
MPKLAKGTKMITLLLLSVIALITALAIAFMWISDFRKDLDKKISADDLALQVNAKWTKTEKDALITNVNTLFEKDNDRVYRLNKIDERIENEANKIGDVLKKSEEQLAEIVVVAGSGLKASLDKMESRIKVLESTNTNKKARRKS